LFASIDFGVESRVKAEFFDLKREFPLPYRGLPGRQSMNPTLLLPVENQVRELDAKLLFSCVAAERGFPVVIGSKQFLYEVAPRYKGSIFIAKSMRKRAALIFRIMNGLGNDVVAWDEESLVRYSSSEYYSWRFSDSTFEPLTHLFSWGEDDRDMFVNYPGIGDTTVFATGNPRADLLRTDVRNYFAQDKQRLIDRYGSFILVNSNFPFVNPFVKRLALVSASGVNAKRSVSRAGSGMSLTFAEGMSEHAQQIFDHFKKLMPSLASWFPDHKIIMRPHPSEDHETWRVAMKGHDNVEVIHEGNAVPWLMASKVLLHNGCTTAVEAAALGVPTVTYQPVQAPSFDYNLPNSVSRQALTEEDVRVQLQAVLDGEQGKPTPYDIEQILSSHLASQSGPLGSDRIIDVLSQSDRLGNRQVRVSNPHYIANYMRAQARSAIKRLNALHKDHWNSARYHSQRFPDISAAEINERIGRFGSVLGRFDDVIATPVSKHVFRIDRKDN
jgi:surface carbohydrate biosynthesis protein